MIAVRCEENSGVLEYILLLLAAPKASMARILKLGLVHDLSNKHLDAVYESCVYCRFAELEEAANLNQAALLASLEAEEQYAAAAKSKRSHRGKKKKKGSKSTLAECQASDEAERKAPCAEHNADPTEESEQRCNTGANTDDRQKVSAGLAESVLADSSAAIPDHLRSSIDGSAFRLSSGIYLVWPLSTTLSSLIGSSAWIAYGKTWNVSCTMTGFMHIYLQSLTK